MLAFLKQPSTIKGIIVMIVGLVAVFEGLPVEVIVNTILVLFGFEQIVIKRD